MAMQLNELSGGQRCQASRKRVGRGIGSGVGKTCGRGHKGQKSRSGGGAKPGFEGGQMPLHRRLPKFGFVSRTAKTHVALTLWDLARVKDVDVIDLGVLKAQDIIGEQVQSAKVILSGKLDQAVKLRGIAATAGAKKAIEAAGGEIMVVA